MTVLSPNAVVPDDSQFCLCLTHDVDRPYKTYQSLYYGVRDRSWYHLRTAVPGRNPYWQFEDLMSLEQDLGVRSAFYFLTAPSQFSRGPRAWLRPGEWVEHFGRYDVTAPPLADIIRTLDDGGWEVGLHGSRAAAVDTSRLDYEKRLLEGVLGDDLLGGRHHHLSLDRPDTWDRHRSVGLRYDSTLGASTEFGFADGYGLYRPFDDEFIVFPITAMEMALPDPGTEPDRAWRACERLLREAAENGAVMTIVWHPRYFNTAEFPGYRRLYRRLVERARELGAWIGPPKQLYEGLTDTIEVD